MNTHELYYSLHFLTQFKYRERRTRYYEYLKCREVFQVATHGQNRSVYTIVYLEAVQLFIFITWKYQRIRILEEYYGFPIQWLHFSLAL